MNIQSVDIAIGKQIAWPFFYHNALFFYFIGQGREERNVFKDVYLNPPSIHVSPSISYGNIIYP